VEQIEIQEIYTQTTMGIRVTVTPQYLADRSDPEQGAYAYSYTVDLENLGPHPVQLKNRHWKVFSKAVQIADIKGEGVIGEQPVINPNETFRYTSWTMIPDTIGSMKGTYTFLSETGEFLDVEIPEFMLIYMDQQTVH